MIIWLASYPKSGNTWVRIFLSSLIYSGDNNFDFDVLKNIRSFPKTKDFLGLCNNIQDRDQLIKNWISAQDIINLNSNTKIFKTHNLMCQIKGCGFTNLENTLGVIHVVRDPRNVLLSINNHFSLNDYEKAKEFLFKEKHWIGIEKKIEDKLQDNMIPTLISSWNIHYQTWKNKTKNYLLIKYEDLQKNPYDEFTKIVKYLEKITNKKFDNIKIEKAVETTSFDYMQNLETDGLFNENSRGQNNKKVKFFNLGPKNDWKEFLNNKIIEKVNFKFKNEMEELGYL